MPSFPVSKFIILPGPLRVSAEFLLLSTGPILYFIAKKTGVCSVDIKIYKKSLQNCRLIFYALRGLGKDFSEIRFCGQLICFAKTHPLPARSVFCSPMSGGSVPPRKIPGLPQAIPSVPARSPGRCTRRRNIPPAYPCFPF